jgi:hypothetical protein
VLLYMVEQFTKNTPNSSTDVWPLQHNFGARPQIFWPTTLISNSDSNNNSLTSTNQIPARIINLSRPDSRAQDFEHFAQQLELAQPKMRWNKPGRFGAPSLSE